MTTGTVVLIALASGLVSSLITTALLVIILKFLGRRHLAQQTEAAGEVVADRVRTALEEAAEDLMPRFRAEVEAGFEEAAERVLPSFRNEVVGGFGEAAEDVLPRLRSEVRAGVVEGAESVFPKIRSEVAQGVQEGLVSAMDPKVVARAGGQVAKAGSSVLEAGLNLVLGRDDED